LVHQGIGLSEGYDHLTGHVGRPHSFRPITALYRSGSMHGQSFDIMKLAAKMLLNTLGADDFVNVAKFSRNVSWVTPCLDTLVQANARNKRLLFDGVDALADKDVAKYDEALNFAYEKLEEFSEERGEGANCHKLVMLFSDGGTDFPAEVVEKYKNKSINGKLKCSAGGHFFPKCAFFHKDLA